MSKRISFDEQRLNCVQLLKDRKAGIGGYNAGLKDFSEMGAVEGGNWPLSAESIRRAFGVPSEKGDPESDYVLTLRAKSHIRLEEVLQGDLGAKRGEHMAGGLREVAPELYRAVVGVYPLDEGGCRDYEWYEEKMKTGKTEAARSEAKSLVIRCDWGVDLITMRMMGDNLFVEFARRRSRLEEKKMEDANAAILADYRDMLAAGRPRKEAANIVCDTHGVSERTLHRIEEARRLEMGGEKRSPGRPPSGLPRGA